MQAKGWCAGRSLADVARALCNRYIGRQRRPEPVERRCKHGSRVIRVPALARTAEGAGANSVLKGPWRILVGKRNGGAESRKIAAGFVWRDKRRVERRMEMGCQRGQEEDQGRPCSQSARHEAEHASLDSSRPTIRATLACEGTFSDVRR